MQVLRKNWVEIAAFGYPILCGVCLVKEWYAVLLLPLVIGAIWSAIAAPDKLLLFIAFCAPLSINIEQMKMGGVGMYLPTEPLLFGLMLLAFLRLLHHKRLEISFLRHPITFAVILHLIWIGFTCLTSEMPVVSLKFLVSRLWFVVTFFFMGYELFKAPNRFKQFLWLYTIAMTLVISYTVAHHATYQFAEKPAHWVMQPFFKDHTSYGAMIAFFLPVVLYFWRSSKQVSIKSLAFFLLLVFIAGTILSYTRAAWVSLIASLLLYLVYFFRIKLVYLLGVAGVAVVIGVMVWPQFLMQLEKNRQDSSDNLAEHVQSISNVSSDASNLERLNRWSSALRMFKERPLTGWGPGTYAFQYAPFQLAREKTIISTNAGDGGNAHSEYIGPLAEQGVLGMLCMLLIVVMVYWRASVLIHELPPGTTRNLVIVAILGLTTYFVHGLLNNYLDTDKSAVPFWGFIAFITAVDLHRKKYIETLDKEELPERA